MANIVIDAGHPAHVHLFRNAARDWQQQGHHVLFTALDREIIVYLLEAYKLPYRVTYRRRKGKLALGFELIFRTLATWRIARQFKADLFISMGNPTVGVPARLMGKPYIGLTDTDHAVEQHALFKPFATLIATPDVFQPDLGPRQVYYRGYHELAYLHPDEFTPDPKYLAPLGLKPGDAFFIVRFVAWRATHDIGQHGFTLAEKRELIQELARHGRVLLSVEGEVEPEFAAYVNQFDPATIHHLLAYATLYVGEGGTLVNEAAVLGVPAIYVNTLRMSNIIDLQDNYGLIFLYDHGRDGLEKARELLRVPDLRDQWQAKRAHLLANKINPTPWFVDVGNGLLKDPHYRPESAR